MTSPILKLYGIREPTSRIEPQEKTIAPTLPPDHPCHSCGILTWYAGKPYCFLPRCDRDIFKSDGSDAKRYAPKVNLYPLMFPTNL